MTLQNASARPAEQLNRPVPPWPSGPWFACAHGLNLGHGCAVCDPKEQSE